MIKKAWAWAKSKGQVRTNPIHGEEEIRIVANETFDFKRTDAETTTTTGNFQVEEPFCCRSFLHVSYRMILAGYLTRACPLSTAQWRPC